MYPDFEQNKNYLTQELRVFIIQLKNINNGSII